MGCSRTKLGVDPVAEETMFKLREEALDWLEVEDDVVALDAKASLYLRANESGAELWRLLADGATRQQLADQLVTVYEIDAERAGGDVDAFLKMVSERGLLSEGDA
jgi:hypothetical protein